MTPDEFRRAGHDLIERIAAYLEDPAAATARVLPDVEPGGVRAQLPEVPPTSAEGWDVVSADIDNIVMPNIANWQHPDWYAYFPANTSYPSVLGDLLAAGLAQQGMSWVTSPVCTELETLMLDWMLACLDLPDRFHSRSAKGGGVIEGSASEGALVAILAARWRATDGAVNADGKTERLIAYVTAQSHSSVEKGLRIAGIGSENIRIVSHDEAYAMRPDAFASAVRTDLEAGLRPFFVCATHGTTSSMAFDPTAAIAPICAEHDIWLHVDAAMAGIAAFASEYRWVNDGLEFADSYSTDPHKWMGVGFDCSLFWTADRAALLEALSILPEYLRSAAAEAGQVIDYRDWQIPLGRRFRALKLWFSLRLDGPDTIAGLIRRNVADAQGLAARIRRDARFEIMAPHDLDLVCVRLKPAGGEDLDSTNARNDALISAINDSGAANVTRTVLDDRVVMRVCVGTRATTARDVSRFWDRVTELVDAMDRRGELP